MSEKKKNLSDYQPNEIPNAEGFTVAIVVAEWNPQITGALLQGALKTLKLHGLLEQNIHIHYVPGSYELTIGAAMVVEGVQPDAVICLGCVIQGETRHFEFICQAVSQGLNHVALTYNRPVIFGVLTTDNMQQALDRAGGKHGNKGDEAAVTAIKMAALHKKLM
jgi:6,7-dimethyl-8-ribityllumazine synthase